MAEFRRNLFQYIGIFDFIFGELTIKTACIRCILQNYFEGMMPDTHQVVTNLLAIRSEKFLYQEHSREHILTQRRFCSVLASN